MKYKANEEIEVDGVKYAVGDEFELSEKQAAGLGEKVSMVEEDAGEGEGEGEVEGSGELAGEGADDGETNAE